MSLSLKEIVSCLLLLCFKMRHTIRRYIRSESRRLSIEGGKFNFMKFRNLNPNASGSVKMENRLIVVTPRAVCLSPDNLALIYLIVKQLTRIIAVEDEYKTKDSSAN